MSLNLSWNARLPCSDAARIRCDEMLGSAAPTTQWLLVEHPGPWPVNAVDVLSRPIRERLLAPVDGLRLRLLLIRRPGRRYERGSELRWGVATQNRGQVWGHWREETDLLAAREAMTGSAEPGESLVLVCTHGIHDQCCAVRGRPIAALLATHWPDQTWECSHLGGDRFAPNVLLAPDGVYYGQLDRETAVGVIQQHFEGSIDVDRLRGFTHMSSPAQVAAAEVHRRQGPGRWDDVTVRSLQRLGSHGWRIILSSALAGPAEIEVEVQREFDAPAERTCKASGPDVAARFSVARYLSG